MKTVVFDLDGTLADTSEDLIAAANACFVGLGHEPMLDPVADQLTAFHGGRAMLRLGFSRLAGNQDETDVDREYPKLLAHYGEHIDVHTTLYPGAEAAVRRLIEAGYRTAVCTNKPEFLAETLLQRLGVRDLFGSLIGADTLPVRKPEPAPYLAAVEQAGGDVRQSYLLGDTVTDVRTARSVGVPIALVSFGPEGHEIKRLSPDHVLENFDHLIDMTTEILGPGR